LEEYSRVGVILAIDHTGVNLKPILDFLIQNAEINSAPLLTKQVCEDPDDDKFIACALASGSKIITSGDKHLLSVSGYQGVEILKPREFLTKYLPNRST
jgi:predicted nucleic acid-binding protein